MGEGGGGADRRAVWLATRLAMERGHFKTTPEGQYRRRPAGRLRRLAAAGDMALHAVGLFARGVANAKDIHLNRLELSFDNLPAAFDGFTIIHLTDLHVDALPQVVAAARRLVAPVTADLCVLTGDYADDFRAPVDQGAAAIAPLVAAATRAQGCIAVLGNHDQAGWAAALRAQGVRVLINESWSLERDGQMLTLTGTDDVSYFYTAAADQALASATGDFKVALVHSPEIADVAAAAGFDLYLTGHTHGGQVCLPGGWPIVTALKRFRRYARGRWRHGKMVGYTSTGVGVSSLPVRFNSRGEVAVIVLRRAGA